MNNLKYEIDVYPFWEETAILEIELEHEKQKYTIPNFIEVIGDVTGNRDYSNSSLVSKFYDKGRYGKIVTNDNYKKRMNDGYKHKKKYRTNARKG